MNVRMFGILAIFLLMVTVPSASAFATVRTDQMSYDQFDSVKFTLTNYGPGPLTIWPYDIMIQKKVGFNWVTVKHDATACAAVDGIDCSIVVPVRGKNAYIWDQKVWVNGELVRADIGTYRGIYNGVKSNIFKLTFMEMCATCGEVFTTSG